MGRTLQKEYGVEAQIVVTLPLLEGIDGVQKMSKSLGNYIGIDEEPNEIYGKAMSVPDELMLKYYELATDLTHEELSELKQGLVDGNVHPRDAKMRLAATFVRMYHGMEAAEAAQQHFVTVFQRRSLPEDIEEHVISAGEFENGKVRLIRLLTLLGFAVSNAEARRSIQQGAVRLNEVKLEDPNVEVMLQDGDVIQSGKRKFAKIKLG